MTVDLEGRVIRGVDIANQAFRNKWKGLPGVIQDEAIKAIQETIGKSKDQLPNRLHFHSLKDKMVPSRLDATKKVAAWSMHITSNDAYKASFTYEDGTLYFRTCGAHDTVDKSP